MEEAALRQSSVSGNWTSDVRFDSNQEQAKDTKGRICTQCQKWRVWEEFHKKKERFASKCKPCIRLQKKLFRKKLRKKKIVTIKNQDKFKCFVHGTLTPAMINNISQIFADAMRVIPD